jgi:hypothetical protein
LEILERKQSAFPNGGDMVIKEKELLALFGDKNSVKILPVAGKAV